jgi:hypothetical protein
MLVGRVIKSKLKIKNCNLWKNGFLQALFAERNLGIYESKIIHPYRYDWRGRRVRRGRESESRAMTEEIF